MFNYVLIVCFITFFCASAGVGSAESLDSLVFPSDEDDKAHSTRQDSPPRTTTSLKPKFGYDSGGSHFNVQPTNNGGFSASASQSNNFAGTQSAGNNFPGSNYASHNFAASQAASQSHSLNFQVGANGFSASQSSSASQAASFNSHYGNQGSSLSASQANSQSSTFGGTAGAGGGSAGAASSQTASAGFSGGSGGGGGAASLASGAANSQSSGGSSGHNHGYKPYTLSPDFIRMQRPRPVTNRNDRRRRPAGPFYNGWFNTYWNARARSPKQG